MPKFEDFLEPESITVSSLRGVAKTYVISKFPAVAGRGIVAKYPLTAMPKFGDYKVNEETMLELMQYVAVVLTDATGKLIPGQAIPLITRALVDNHVPDWEALARIEYAMLKYNTSFFTDGEISNFLKSSIQKFLVSVSPTLKVSLAQLLDRVKQLSTNLKQSTP